MLKRSDYVACILSFAAMLAFYLIMAGNLAINLGIYERLTPILMPQEYDSVNAWETAEPEIAVLCGSQGDGGTQEIVELLANLKKPYGVVSTVEEINAERLDVIIVTAESWDEIGDGDALLRYAQEGKTLIFAHMMTGTDAQERNKTLGVLHDEGSAEIEGILLSEKLLIQGQVYHNNLACTVSKVTVDARCGKLMVEWAQDTKERRDLIPLIWEKQYGEGRFYVVNGGFLTGEYGMGILTGLLSRAEDVFVYPVVNAKVNLLDSFPVLDNPYEEQLRELYSRDTNMFLRDLVWPSMVKLCETHGLVISTRMDGPSSAGVQRETQSLMDMIRHRGCEVAEGARELALPYTCSGHLRTAESVFKMQTGVSGQGLAVHYLDMTEVMGENADDPGYEWNAYYLELSKLMHEIYQDTDWMDAMTLSMAEERYKRYVLIQPEIRMGEDHISIETEGFDEVCFYIVRTKKRAVAGNNCEVTQIGETAYLVKAMDREATVWLRDRVQ